MCAQIAFPPHKVMIFVDGSNLYWSARDRGIKIDHIKIIDILVGTGRTLVRPYFYCSIGMPPAPKQIGFQEMLKFQGYTVVTKPLKKMVFTATELGTGRRVSVERWSEKGVDVALVTDMLSMGYKDAYDTAILVGGDADYLSAVRDIKSIPKRVEIAAFSDTDQANVPPAYKSTIGREMKMEADVFYALETLQDKIIF